MLKKLYERKIILPIILVGILLIVLFFNISSSRTKNYLKKVSQIDQSQINNFQIGKYEYKKELLTINEEVAKDDLRFNELINIKNNFKNSKEIIKKSNTPSFFYLITIQTQLEDPFNQIDIYVDPIDFNIWIPSMDSKYNEINDGYLPRITQKWKIDKESKELIKKIIKELVE